MTFLLPSYNQTIHTLPPSKGFSYTLSRAWKGNQNLYCEYRGSPC